MHWFVKHIMSEAKKPKPEKWSQEAHIALLKYLLARLDGFQVGVTHSVDGGKYESEALKAYDQLQKLISEAEDEAKITRST